MQLNGFILFLCNCFFILHFEDFMIKIIKQIFFEQPSKTYLWQWGDFNEIDTAAGIPHVVALLFFISQVSQQSV